MFLILLCYKHIARTYFGIASLVEENFLIIPPFPQVTSI